MKWQRYVPVGTPYRVGDVVSIEPGKNTKAIKNGNMILVTCEGARGIYIKTGKPLELNRSCTEISTIVPPEHWPDWVCTAVAKYQLVGKLDGIP